MVDIHSHVLHGLDDGARTFEDSVAMLEMAAAAGTTDIVATPHANPEYQFQPDLIRERADALQAAVGGKIRLHTGCDLHLSFENIQDALANPRKYTIGGRNYLLVEFSDLTIFPNSGELLAHLHEAGMLPVITHPERNVHLQQRLEQLTDWVSQGAYLQVTAHSLLGLFGRRAKDFAHKLVENRVAHFVASDAHDVEHRTPRLDEAFAELSSRYGEELATAACIEYPRAAVEGGEVPQRLPAPARRKWRFWN